MSVLVGAIAVIGALAVGWLLGEGAERVSERVGQSAEWMVEERGER